MSSNESSSFVFEELTNTLVSMTAFKEKVLLRENSAQKKFAKTDMFLLNPEYFSKKSRVKIHTVEKVEKSKQDKLMETKILKERMHVIDAALIKIMKHAKSLLHGDLVAQLFNYLKLPSEKAVIQERIAGLVEREYLKVDSNNKELYTYIA